jgi:hypothetical protein
LIASFGEPATVASLIRRAARRKRRRPVSLHAIAAAIALLAGAYGIAFARLASFPATKGPRALDAELASIAATIATAERSLRTPSEVEASVDIARELTVAGSLWRRVAGMVLLETAMRAGDTVLTIEGQRQLLVRLEDELRLPVADSKAVAEAKRALVERLLGSDGHMDQGRLQVLRLAKGVGRPRLSARLLEPVYFSRAIDAAELHALAEQLVRQRVAAAEAARGALLLRLASMYDVATS